MFLQHRFKHARFVFCFTVKFLQPLYNLTMNRLTNNEQRLQIINFIIKKSAQKSSKFEKIDRVLLPFYDQSNPPTEADFALNLNFALNFTLKRIEENNPPVSASGHQI